ncbi:TPA: hypothetical protein ACQWGQ_000682 [Neisseria subflava]|uniref:hypothetical protein n=2 Tax=Neisseriaceae TaxID=481 RepID=UPI00202A028A|nr:hypothetical protein [Neisseria subflava]MCL9787154.1 hypothetical protein [Neisseria subflava]
MIQAQLQAFLTLLITLYAQNMQPEDKQNLRWQQFNRLLEQHFSTQHQVGFYAAQLACSEKTLGTLCLAQSGLSTKTVITDRLLLEAKHLLIHTSRTKCRLLW